MDGELDPQLPLGLGIAGPLVFEYEPVQELADSSGLYDRCQVIQALLDMPENGKLSVETGRRGFPTVTARHKGKEVVLQLSVDDEGTYLLTDPTSHSTSGVTISEGQIAQLGGEELSAKQLATTTRALLKAYALEVGIPSHFLKKDSRLLTMLEDAKEEGPSRIRQIMEGIGNAATGFSRLFARRENTFVEITPDGETHRYTSYGKPNPADIEDALSHQQILARSRLRPRLAGPLLVLLLAPNPLNLGDTAETAGISYPQPLIGHLGDELVNRSEHNREDFDRRGISLPELASSVGFGEGRVDVAVLASSFDLPEGLSDAPSVNAGARERNAGDNNYSDTNSGNSYQFGFVQDVYGGVRHVIELHEARDDDILPPGECGTIDARVEPDDRVRVVDLSGNWLSAAVDGDIHICNAGETGIHKDQLDNVYIQVIEDQ